MSLHVLDVIRDDLNEVKADVKRLLEHKHRTEGRVQVIAFIVSAVVSVVGWLASKYL